MNILSKLLTTNIEMKIIIGVILFLVILFILGRVTKICKRLIYLAIFWSSFGSIGIVEVIKLIYNTVKHYIM